MPAELRKLEFEEIEEARRSAGAIAGRERHPVIAILEDIRSLYNVGSCFRTADAMLLGRLVLCGYTPRPPRPEIEKTALGATETVPWEEASTAVEAIATLQNEGYKVFALEIAQGALELDRAVLPEGPIAFVAGNELTGVRPETLAACDGAIEIPMFGTKHSLNVAVAVGIAAWELVRRARSATPPRRSPDRAPS